MINLTPCPGRLNSKNGAEDAWKALAKAFEDAVSDFKKEITAITSLRRSSPGKQQRKFQEADGGLPTAIQDLACTSPIWYTPNSI